MLIQDLTSLADRTANVFQKIKVDSTRWEKSADLTNVPQ